MTVADLQRKARHQLAATGIESAALDARLIVQHVIGLSHEELIARPDRCIDAGGCARVDAAVARRLGHEPVSRIIGEREFFGRSFTITPDVLDPRPDSETLIEQVLDIAELAKPDRPRLRIADIGTGSGVIIITLLAELTGASATASDVSQAALEIARRNALRHGVAGRVDFVRTSWLTGVNGPFDVIVSNPPYIASADLARLSPEVRAFDPAVALDGGDDGLAAYRAILPQAQACLADGGYLCVEVGAGQAGDVTDMMMAAGFDVPDGVAALRDDLAGHARVITVCKPRLCKPGPVDADAR